MALGLAPDALPQTQAGEKPHFIKTAAIISGNQPGADTEGNFG
ncbi:hypothetical protein [Rhodococcus sp. SG20037]|nr:hypothetical protein [Rhodococcus sp. SG20037]WNF44421.1 hypothetical protein RHP72_13880 [Rhodococcus sp. SG20037]